MINSEQNSFICVILGAISYSDKSPIKTVSLSLNAFSKSLKIGAKSARKSEIFWAFSFVFAKYSENNEDKVTALQKLSKLSARYVISDKKPNFFICFQA